MLDGWGVPVFAEGFVACVAKKRVLGWGMFRPQFSSCLL